MLAQAALAALIGSGASYAYLILLQRQVDAVLPTDSVPIWDAEDNVEGFARPFAIGAAAYRFVLTHPDLMLSCRRVQMHVMHTGVNICLT